RWVVSERIEWSKLAIVVAGVERRSPDDFELFLEVILEAPRGPREVFPDGRYRPSYKNGPTAGLMPCAGGNGCGHGGWKGHGDHGGLGTLPRGRGAGWCAPLAE